MSHQNQNQNRNRYDQCFKDQQMQGNKSIFEYVTDTAMFENNSTCFDDTPPFLGYIPRGIEQQSVDIENDLRGANRPVTKCVNCKYAPSYPELSTTGMNVINNKAVKVTPPPNPKGNKQLCKPEKRILPNQYAPAEDYKKNKFNVKVYNV